MGPATKEYLREILFYIGTWLAFIALQVFFVSFDRSVVCCTLIHSKIWMNLCDMIILQLANVNHVIPPSPPSFDCFLQHTLHICLNSHIPIALILERIDPQLSHHCHALICRFNHSKSVFFLNLLYSHSHREHVHCCSQTINKMNYTTYKHVRETIVCWHHRRCGRCICTVTSSLSLSQSSNCFYLFF